MARTLARKLRSIEAAANYLGVSQRTIRRYISEGKLPAVYVGEKLIRVDQADIEALIRQLPAASSS